VTEAVLEFFKTGKTLKQVGHTNLVLIPKIQCLKEAGDFRPIACCNVVYKCISKLICNRLRELLPHLVDGSQCAFILGREIMHNVMLCQELTCGYIRKTISPRCIMKLDLRKAYDSVNHGFIQGILKGMKFPNKFINWVMGCLKSAFLSISLNGGQHGFFQGKGGLK